MNGCRLVITGDGSSEVDWLKDGRLTLILGVTMLLLELSPDDLSISLLKVCDRCHRLGLVGGNEYPLLLPIELRTWILRVTSP